MRQKRGEVALHMAIILLVGVLLLATAMEVQHIYSTVSAVRDKTSEAVLSVAAANVSRVYGGTREASGAARRFNGTHWESLVSTREVLGALAPALGATATGDASLSREGSYEIQQLHTTFSGLEQERLTFKTTMTLKIRFSVGGALLPPLAHRVEVHTTYDAKFE